jgi:hypothetical protein
MSNPHRATARRSIEPSTGHWGWLVFVLCCFGFFLRVLNAHADLGTPHVDENAIVDQAVAFMGGEWRYYLLEYGPLPMYLLAGVYHLMARAHGLSAIDYASRVFFDYEEQYFIARLFGVVCYALLAFAVYRVFAPRFGRWAAAVSSLLLSLPYLDMLTASKARVDVPQGACQVAALLCLCLALDSSRLRYWLLGGLAAGCAFACKPMPALLIAPCFIAASWFASEAEVAAVTAASAEPRPLIRAAKSIGRRVLHTLRRPSLWGAALVALLAAAAANPTSLDVRAFIAAQRGAISYYSGSKAPGEHQNVFQAFLALGTPFLLAAVIGLFASAFLRDARARLIALFPLVYALGFWGRPMRSYYLVAPSMGLCLVIGILSGVLLDRLASSQALPALARRLLGPAVSLSVVALIAAPRVAELEHTRHIVSGPTLAREWILAHVPSGTKFFQLGAYGDGPRLVSDSREDQAKYADYFEYGREHYQFLRTAFRLAYERYVDQGRPRYGLEHTRRRAEPLSARMAPWLSQSLDEHAIKYGEEYILLCRFGGGPNVLDLKYRWFKSVDLVQQFGRVAIFHVHLPKAADPAPASDPSSRTTRASEQRPESGTDGEELPSPHG